MSVPNEWHTVDQYNPVHHAEILDKKKEADYESIKSEPHRAVEYLNKDKRRSSAASDAKSNEYESIKSVNTAKKSSSSDKGEELGHQVAMLDSSFEHIYHTPIIITHLNKDETSRPQIPPPIPPFGAKKLRVKLINNGFNINFSPKQKRIVCPIIKEHSTIKFEAYVLNLLGTM